MQGSSYAPLQFLRSPWNRDVYTAIDNQIDGRTTLVLYLGAASTLPSELQKYNVGCILIHKDEKQIYLNIGSDTTPTWQSFGPGTNTLPTPFVAGQYLTNDGVDAFWSLIDLATGVTGLLDSDHIDLSDLANNSDFIDFLVANAYFTTSLANDTNFTTTLGNNNNFINTLTSNVNFQNAVNTFVSGSGVLQIDQTPDNGTFGLLAGDVDGVNDTYTVSLGAYAAGKLQVYLNGLIQLQGASDDYVELVPGSGTFQFNTPPATNDIITVVYSGSASVVDNYTVKATTADTAPSFLDSKIELVSGTNTTVTKTIINPGANEKIRYQVNSGINALLSPGSERFTPNGGRIVSFGDYLITESSFVLGFELHTASYIDVNGSYFSQQIPVSVHSPSWGPDSYVNLHTTLSEDKTKLYQTRFYRQGSPGPVELVVDELDLNLNIINTFVYASIGSVLVPLVTGFTFVSGNKIIIGYSDVPTGIGFPLFATEFTMSAGLLILPTTTNMVIGTVGVGPSNLYGYGYKHSDGFVYLDFTAGPNNTIRKYTYTSPNLSSTIDTTTYQNNINSITPNNCYEGFEINGSNVGWYRNTGTSPNRFLYQIYPF